MSQDINQEASTTQYPVIEFYEHNSRRAMRNAPSVRFKVQDAADEGSHLLWMTKSDIKENIKLFPHAKEALEEGLKYYH
ncbi:TPA: hypothetical protein I7730_15670 [Vibrio vulnificus]|uniref:Uncharacterized protein n=1 Tax=Vibrio vulnificus TaxID=672 RepID=A0A8H9N1S2_VIBVL|nr:hypothetical protein [Vibrio vulnificus]HAS8541220.1 hypothetical protein [Vibrio vulnificus]